ncbi:hypothetical protein [Roseospirillum parvum]|uniref:Uncharacterized protein n=1 Tax=Roseospirillum parvum TaxID=83401 RepID=A0A1G8EUC7_9PROT|nr:hypothetical protein [Roseospirillum parvum]SDH73503.1 hypothetical protein SAMN05421742_11142 [Roseospirillum parvum]
MKDISIYRLKRIETGIEELAGAVARLEGAERAGRAARLVPAPASVASGSRPEADLTVLAAENATLKADLEDARETIAGLEEALAAARTLGDEAGQRLADAPPPQADPSESDSSASAALTEARQENDRLRQDNEDLRHAVSTAEARLDAALDRLKGLLAPSAAAL